METLTFQEMFDPGFLLKNSVYISLLIGFICPLVGMHLVLRRLIFLGVALPQVSSCGIAFAFALPAWGLIAHRHDSAEERTLAFLGSIAFTLVTILILAFLERRRRGVVEGRVGMVFVLASAWSILLLVKNPHGEHGMLDLLRGEIIAVSDTDLAVTAGTFIIIAANLFLFQREFLLISFDREMAVTLKKAVTFWDAILFIMIGLTVSTAVLTVGPMVTFGFLLIPPLTAHLFARTTQEFAIASSAIGGLAALFGFKIAYEHDLPVGPVDVALLGVIYIAAFLLKKAAQAFSKPAVQN